MKLKTGVPGLEDVSSIEFDDFSEYTTRFFDTVVPREILCAIEYSDIVQAESHPNGFYIIRLSDPQRKLDGQVRIHIWQADSNIDRSKAEIHKHPWHLASKVLFGKYVEQIADVKHVEDEEAANYISIRMERDIDTGNNRYVDPEFVSVELSKPHVYETGSTHYLSEPTYHHTPINSTGLVVTMPIMGCSLNDQRRFLAPIGNISRPVEDLHHRGTEDEVDAIWLQVQEAVQTISGETNAK
jgi:hypothetical protein